MLTRALSIFLCIVDREDVGEERRKEKEEGGRNPQRSLGVRVCSHVKEHLVINKPSRVHAQNPLLPNTRCDREHGKINQRCHLITLTNTISGYGSPRGYAIQIEFCI